MKTYAITESMDTGCSIWKDIKRLERKASIVKVVAATTLASIRDRIAHARLVSLSFAEW